MKNNSRRLWIAWGGSFATILAFDLLWSMATSFRALSFPATYIFGATLALLMALPAIIGRGRWAMGIVLAAADLLAIANLMYCRTYFGPIPPASYLLAGNVAEFGDAIRHSLTWLDLVFPAITIATLYLLKPNKQAVNALKPNRGGETSWRRYLLWLMAGIAGCVVCAICYGGVFRHIEFLKGECYYRATPPVVYTLPVSILADLMESNRPVTEEEIAQARGWLAEADRIRRTDTTAIHRRYVPDNVVMIIVESLEAWPIGRKIECREITPKLNRLLQDSATTWKGEKVLSQVGPGRSIDGQLLMTAGLLPMADQVYSMRFPDHTYPHLAQAFNREGGRKSYLLSGDRATTWNQGAMAKTFRIDETRFRDSWDSGESFGHPRNPSDGSFLRQVAEKMHDGELWPIGEKAFVEIITYSSHFPFTIPPEHRRIKLNGEYPAPLGDYITAINYTDNAIGDFIDYLKTRPDFDRTMVVIVGDHEGLASWRASIRGFSPEMAGLVEGDSFVPMIVLNSPVSGTRRDVMGQVDVYSTILDMAGLYDRPDIFPGMGFSALRDGSPRFAYDMTGMRYGESTAERNDTLARHLESAYRVSSTIIRANLLNSEEE